MAQKRKNGGESENVLEMKNSIGKAQLKVRLETLNIPIKRRTASSSEKSSEKPFIIQDGDQQLSVNCEVDRVICKFCKTKRYLKPMFCESASPRVESASRVNESSQRVGESPVSSGSKIPTVLFEFWGTFLWLWTLFKCREESTSQQVHESASRDSELASLKKT